MHNLRQFIIKHHVIILFILLEEISILLLARSQSFHRNWMVNTTNDVVGKVYFIFLCRQEVFALDGGQPFAFSGLAVAGDAIIGADSHTCTYGALGAFSTGVGSTDMAAGMVTGKAWFKVPSAIKFNITGKPAKWVSGKDVILHIIGMIGVDGALYKSMEFTGDGIKNLTMDDRFTIANMAIEAGGKNGIFPVDDLTEEYLKSHGNRPYKVYEADPDAVYDEEYTIDLSTLKPTVSFPHLPENTHTVDEIKDPIRIDQAVIGSCTNGRMDDLRIAAKVLCNRKHIVYCTPYRDTLQEGTIDRYGIRQCHIRELQVATILNPSVRETAVAVRILIRQSRHISYLAFCCPSAVHSTCLVVEVLATFQNAAFVVIYIVTY